MKYTTGTVSLAPGDLFLCRARESYGISNFPAALDPVSDSVLSSPRRNAAEEGAEAAP